MSEFFGFLIFVGIAAIIIHLIIKNKNKETEPVRRLPYYLDSISQNQAHSATLHSSRKPYPISSPPSQQISSTTRQRSIAQINEDNNYLSYRNCPDCHSENTIGNHVIHKNGPNRFKCTVCGLRFKI